jgi:uncharacterized protein YecE (DUF72 family)
MRILPDLGETLQNLHERASHLGNALGHIFYQLSPNWRANLPRLEYFLSGLHKQQAHVLEFRDERWLIESVFPPMERYQVVHCIHDMYPLNIPARVTDKCLPSVSRHSNSWRRK